MSSLIVLGLGLWHLNQPLPTGEPLRVGVVQASTPQEVKNTPLRHRTAILQTYRGLSEQAVAAGAQLLVWPEAAWPGYLPTDVTRLPAQTLGVPLLMGVGLFEASDSKADGDKELPQARRARLFNSALWLNAQLQVNGRYDKQQLVPFGEYVPLGWLLPVQKLVPGSVDFTPGTASIPLGPYALGVLICYDGVYPAPARHHVRAGAQLLVNLTNDAWYGASSAPYQHRDFYILRAIETGRWVVRAANSGLTLSIDPHGRLGPSTALGARTWLLAVVQRVPLQVQTLYSQLGDTCLAACLGLTTGAALRWLRGTETF